MANGRSALQRVRGVVSDWLDLLERAVVELNWFEACSDCSRNPWFEQEWCGLMALLHYLKARTDEGDHSAACTREARRSLGHAVECMLQAGYTLRSHLPGVPKELQNEWLGSRLVFLHRHCEVAAPRFTTVVCSRLGRGGNRLPTWPRLLDVVLQTVRRSGDTFLFVPSTAFALLAKPLIADLDLPVATLHMAEQDETTLDGLAAAKQLHDSRRIARWLEEILRTGDGASALRDELWLSPACSAALPHLQSLPLQDRVAICWSRLVNALSIRPGGTIERLLLHRLHDPRFEAGTVKLLKSDTGAQPHLSFGARALSTTGAATVASGDGDSVWMERGAVTWYVPAHSVKQADIGIDGCVTRIVKRSGRQETMPSLPKVQWTAAHALVGARENCKPDSLASESLPEQLVHCVRGHGGGASAMSARELVRSAWLAGCVADDSPLHTLLKIVTQRRLRSSAHLSRASEACVCFSAVPLDELVRRRAYQSHLGRWDWEPYGLLVRRTALQQLGARPVVYGDTPTFQRLSAREMAFFQPAKRRGLNRLSARPTHQDWEQEREWRLIGDLRLDDLPAGSVSLFVHYAQQAQALSQYSPWPIIWLQEAQTQQRPTSSERQRRTVIRTNKN